MEQHQSNAPIAPAKAARLMRLATYASIGVALSLVLLKLVAWWISDALSLLATLVDSTLDVAASLVNLIAVRHALSPADAEHRFGHGKAEALAGLAQSAFVAGSAVLLLLAAGRRLLYPETLDSPGPGIAVMLVSMVMTLALLAFQRHVVSRTGSTAIAADALHYRTDVLMNAAVIAALLLASRGWPGFDPLFALLIAVYILASVRAILRRSLDHLMDRELPDSEREHIQRLVGEHPHVRGMHDLRTRRAGTATFIQLHLELDDRLPLVEAHRISDEVEGAIAAQHPGAEVMIHFDPVSVVAAELAASPPPGSERVDRPGEDVGPGTGQA